MQTHLECIPSFVMIIKDPVNSVPPLSALLLRSQVSDVCPFARITAEK